VLQGIDFTVRRGEMMFLVGPSGSGKTTLLSVMCGTLQADAGEIVVFGQALQTMADRPLTRFRARHVGFIFQQFNLIPSLSAGDNVSVPLLIQGRHRSEALDRAREVVAQVGLADKFDDLPARLSGGQQQRIAIARALVHEPDLLICDEPTSALDSHNGQQIMELLRDIARDARRSVIVVTHDQRIYGYADRMAEMEDGRILRVLDSPQAIASAHIL
ncbi:MAG: ABC transporter ATP-binding protein, partial [Azoarcus sp.]|nr:ABC transporter ATP-binding protein [Azoarcus sp.]